MAERVARLYGPAAISSDTDSPTTLFTVPSKELYIARGIHVVGSASSGAAGAAGTTLLIGKTNLAAGNIIYGFSATSATPGGRIVGSEGVSLPFTEGEVIVAALAGFTTPSKFPYDGTAATNFTESSGDATSLAVTATSNDTLNTPANVFCLSANTKASSADALTSIVDAHTPGIINTASIVTAVSGTATSVRTSIWGGYLPDASNTSAATTYTWGGTFTAAAILNVLILPSAFFAGTPSTSNIVLQTASNTGTTETTYSVTMAPSVEPSFQLLLVGQNGSTNSTFTNTPTGAIQLDTFSQTVPNFTGGAWLIPTSQTNPSVTIGAAGSNWSATCIEVAYAGHPTNLTLSGIIIKE